MKSLLILSMATLAIMITALSGHGESLSDNPKTTATVPPANDASHAQSSSDNPKETATDPSPNNANNKSPSENLKEALLTTLRQYLNACVTGDVENFRKLRDPEEIKRLEAILAAKGQKISSENIKPAKPETALKILDYPIIQVVSKGDFARLTFLAKNLDASGKAPEETEIMLVLFRKHAGNWKVVRLGPVTLAKGELTANKTFSEERVPPIFRLPK